jgi:hypothetical protein
MKYYGIFDRPAFERRLILRMRHRIRCRYSGAKNREIRQIILDSYDLNMPEILLIIRDKMQAANKRRAAAKLENVR